MTNFFSRFSTDTTLSIILNQAVMVILTVYGGGVFIAWNDTPIYWVWLQETSVFTQASRALAMKVAQYIDYECSTVGGQCYGPMGELFPCDARPDFNNQGMVKGRTVMYLAQGTSRDSSEWIAFGYLVLICVSYRLGALLLMYYPMDVVLDKLKQRWSTGVDEQILTGMISLRRVEGGEYAEIFS